MPKSSNLITIAILLLLLGAAVVFAVRLAQDPRGRDVRPDDLVELIDRADRVVVRQESGEGLPVLYESSDRRDLAALKAALKVERPEEPRICACMGTPSIFLYAGRERVGLVTNHHAKWVRYGPWNSDAALPDPEPLLRWFDERGITEPRAEYDRGRRQTVEFQEALRKWLEAMPTSLRPVWPTVSPLERASDLAPLLAALAVQLPDRREQVLALFAWYGSGVGPWNGYYSHEDVAAKMLEGYDTTELIGALEGRALTPAQTEGTARLFAGWATGSRHGDLGLLPAGLKARLREHALASSDEDKRWRAKRAFGER